MFLYLNYPYKVYTNTVAYVYVGTIITVYYYYLLIYLLTYPMEHSPSEATRFSASQEIPHI